MIRDGSQRRITFSQSMLDAVLAGRKWQTRRLAMRTRPKKGREGEPPGPSVWLGVRPGAVLLMGRGPHARVQTRRVILDVRIERLHAISAADIEAEGIFEVEGGFTWMPGDPACIRPTPRIAMIGLWESIHGPGTWGQNPEVVVLEFERPKAVALEFAPPESA